MEWREKTPGKLDQKKNGPNSELFVRYRI